MQQLLHFQTIGSGKPVVFLHGFLESVKMWSTLDLASKDFQSILIDLPGHGLSKNEDNSEAPSIEYMSNEVMLVLNYLQITDFDIVGHSMGGYVALNIKKRFTNCNKVVLLNSNFWQDSELKKKDRVRVASIVLQNKNLFLKEAIPNLYLDQIKYKVEIKELLDDALKMDEFAISYSSLAMASREDNTSVLALLPSDFHIIQGEKDAIVPLQLMKEQIGDLAIELKIIKNVGHMSHHESAFEVSHILDSILN